MTEFISFSKDEQASRLAVLLKPYFNNNISVTITDLDRPRSSRSYDQRVDFYISINSGDVLKSTYNYYRNIIACSLTTTQYHHLLYFEKMKHVYKAYLRVLDDYNLLHLDINASKMINSFPNEKNYLFSHLHNIVIENAFVDILDNNLRSLAKLTFHFNEKTISLYYDFELQQFELIYHLSKVSNKGHHIITKNLISTNFYSMFEEMVYDYYLKKEYNIKKRTAKQLNLIKMMRY